MTNQKREREEEKDVRNQNTLRRQWEYEYEKHIICPDQADTDATREKKE